jgi:Spirocyclase AveC-like
VLIRTGVYMYPGGIRGVSLFAGETYQFPLTEGFFFGGLGVGSLAALKHFKDDRGYTFVERGVERLGLSVARQTLLRFLAIFGFFHAAFLLLYGVPNQWLATHSDPFPQGYPSYLLNGMCVYGANGDQCPGPGVLMPRPANNPF